MKKRLCLLLLVVCVLVVCGCKERSYNTDNNGNNGNNSNNNSENNTEPTENTPKVHKDLKKYIKENINTSEKSENTQFLMTLEDALTENLSVVENIVLQEDIQNCLLNNFDKTILSEEALDTIENDDIKNELKKIYKSGYFILKMGVNYLPAIDYSSFLIAKDDLNDDVKEYYALKAHGVVNPVLASGKVLIKPVDILKRINNIENFIKKYPDFPRNNDFTVRYQSWLYLLLTGTTLNPIVDENNHLTPDYANLVKATENPVTMAESGIKEGYELLQKTNYSNDEKTMASLRGIVKEKTENLRLLSNREEDN